MEVAAILLLILLIILVVNQNTNLTRQLSRLEAEFRLLRNQLLKTATEATQKKEVPEPVVSAPPIIVETVKEPSPYKSLFTVVADTAPVAEPSTQQVIDNIPEQPIAAKALTAESEVDAGDVYSPVPWPPKREVPLSSPSFFERHPDMEKFIGENLVNKIGIAILVLAIGFFVKYAIDQNWVGPVGRVSIGILCGGILIALAHRMRNNYKSFSSVLAGGGLAVFYFTITLAYHQFNLFSQTTAFTIMVVITLFAVLLSLLYDKQELAIIALVGGFAAPFLVSDGSGNYKILFTYLIILNGGLLIIAYNKAWRLLNLLSFIFTALLVGSWLSLLKDDEPVITFKNGFLFATVFYLLYFIINIAHNIKEKKKFISSDFGILLAGTCLYFSAGIYCLHKMQADELKGLFSASMGIFNLTATYFLSRKQKVDSNILYLLIGITLTFISITAPIQLHGNYITLFWASEAVLLYWLFTKATLSIIQYAAVLVWILMLASLVIDWIQLYAYQHNAITIIANKGFITTLFAAIATYILFILHNKENKKGIASSTTLLPNKNTYRASGIILLFISGLLEINYQFNYYYPDTNLNILYLLLYLITFLSILTFINQKNNHLNFYSISGIFTACIALYLVSIPTVFFMQQDILTGEILRQNNSIHFFAHWGTALLIASVIYRLIKLLQLNATINKDSFNVITWVVCAIIVIYLSVEISLITNSIFYSISNPWEKLIRIYVKTGLPILWGICSFVFMWLGMQYKYRTLRIISLSLFTLTLLKLFIFDIRNIPAGGKIAAFFCLGVLLLVISFMYQRLKKIIIDNEAKVE